MKINAEPSKMTEIRLRRNKVKSIESISWWFCFQFEFCTLTLNLDTSWIYDIVDALLKERNIYRDDAIREGTTVASMERRLELLGKVSLAFDRFFSREQKELGLFVLIFPRTVYIF